MLMGWEMCVKLSWLEEEKRRRKKESNPNIFFLFSFLFINFKYFYLKGFDTGNNFKKNPILILKI